MEPPGLNISPSRVTILSEWLCRLAMARALSILSTTSILPRRYRASSVNSLSHSTSWLAKPTAPFSLVSDESTLISLPLIAESGRNVARPNLFCFKKAISPFAVSSLSVTIFWIVPPNAVSMAVSYCFFVLMISATTPTMPLYLSFCSITFLMLFP